MALANYTDLKTSIANWLNRSDLDSYIDDFIDLAESRINRDIRIRPMQARATVSTTSGDDTIELPSDFLEAKSLRLNTDPKTFLQYVSHSHLTSVYGGSVTGQPKMFTIVGDEIILGPTPDGTYTVELSYWSKLTALDATNTTNWAITNAPELYLYGALIASAPFIRDDTRIALWGKLFDDALAKVNQSYADSGSSGMQIRSVR